MFKVSKSIILKLLICLIILPFLSSCFNSTSTKKHIVSFETNCDTLLIERLVVSGEVTEEPEPLTKPGYRFKGWYTDDLGSDLFDFSTPITKNLVLYALWEYEVSSEITSKYQVYINNAKSQGYKYEVKKVAIDTLYPLLPLTEQYVYDKNSYSRKDVNESYCNAYAVNDLYYEYHESDNVYYRVNTTNLTISDSIVDFIELKLYKLDLSKFEYKNNMFVAKKNELTNLKEEVLGLNNQIECSKMTLSIDKTLTISCQLSFSNIEYSYEINNIEFGTYNNNLPNTFDKSYTSSSLDKLNDLENETKVIVKGKVQCLIGNTALIEDNNKIAFVVFDNEDKSKFVVSNIMMLSGTLNQETDYNKITNLNDVYVIDKNEENNNIITDLLNIDDYLYQVIDVENSQVNDTSQISLGKIGLSIGDNTIYVVVSNTLTKTQYDKWYNDLENINKDYILILNNFLVVKSDHDYYLTLTEEATWSFSEKLAIKNISLDQTLIDLKMDNSIKENMDNIVVNINYNNNTSDKVLLKDTIITGSYNLYQKGLYPLTINYEGHTFDFELNVYDTKQKITTLDEYITESTELAYGLSATNNPKMLVIPVDFTDYPAPKNMITRLNTAFFGESDSLDWESVHSYYQKTSYNKLNITGTVLDVYHTNRKSSYYENAYKSNENIDYDIIKGALMYYDDSIDYSEYDTNLDGYIDALCFIYTAPVSFISGSDLWWAYTYEYYTDGYEYYDNVEADFYMFAGYDFIDEAIAEYDDGRNDLYVDINAITYIHETGHLLGLDDYYDYNGVTGGLGGGDMMDANIGDHNPYSKAILGWTTPIIATNSVTIELNPYEETGDCIMIPKNWNGTYFDEYYLVDYYTPTGLNAICSGSQGLFSSSGIRVFHVSSKLKSNNSQNGIWELTENDNSNTTYPLIKLIEKTGNDIKNGNLSNNSDLFQSGDTISNKRWNNGNYLNFSIKVVSITNNIATIEINFN